MFVVKAKVFRKRQTDILKHASEGRDVVILSRTGAFRLVPLNEEEKKEAERQYGIRKEKELAEIEDRAQRIVADLKAIKNGTLVGYSLEETLKMLKEDDDDDNLSKEELNSIERGLEDLKNGRTYRMKESENLEDFIKRVDWSEKP